MREFKSEGTLLAAHLASDAAAAEYEEDEKIGEGLGPKASHLSARSVKATK